MFEDCVLRDRAAYFPAEETLVLADVHLGKDRASNVEFPLGEREDVLERLGALLSEFEPEEVVVAGDLLHSFGHLPYGAEESLRAFEKRVAEADARLVATRGNHDTMLDSLLDGTVTAHRMGEALVCHGHERAGSAEGYVLGHVHPAITIEGTKRPCYLLGPAAGGGRALVLPAFTRLAAGVDVSRAEALRSPLLGPPGAFRPVVRDEDANETLEFPPLSELRAFL